MLRNLILYWLTHGYAIICSIAIAAGDYFMLAALVEKSRLGGRKNTFGARSNRSRPGVDVGGEALQQPVQQHHAAQANSPGDSGGHRPHHHLLAHVLDAHHTVDHPEHAVVEVAEEQRAQGGRLRRR